MQNIKRIYLYAVSLIALVIIVIGAVMLLNLILQTYIFKKADLTDYYPVSKIDCARMESQKEVPLPEYCTDPNYEEKEKQLAENRRAASKQRQASNAIAMIIVATPVFLYHWKLARKEV